jgi:hypothetical protein
MNTSLNRQVAVSTFVVYSAMAAEERSDEGSGKRRLPAVDRNAGLALI